MLKDLGFLLIMAAALSLLAGSIMQVKTATDISKPLGAIIAGFTSASVVSFIAVDTSLLSGSEADIMLATAATAAVAIGSYLITTLLFTRIQEPKAGAAEIQKIEKEIFWHNFIQETSRAEPGTYQVSREGHLTKQS